MNVYVNDTLFAEVERLRAKLARYEPPKPTYPDTRFVHMDGIGSIAIIGSTAVRRVGLAPLSQPTYYGLHGGRYDPADLVGLLETAIGRVVPGDPFDRQKGRLISYGRACRQRGRSRFIHDEDLQPVLEHAWSCYKALTTAPVSRFACTQRSWGTRVMIDDPRSKAARADNYRRHLLQQYLIAQLGGSK